LSHSFGCVLIIYKTKSPRRDKQMLKRRIIRLIIAALWVMISSPYFATTFLLAHGSHRITSNIENGALALVLHHHGETSDHHHPDHHQDSGDHSTKGDDHYIEAISADVANISSLKTQIFAKYIPVVSFLTILSVLARVVMLEPPHHSLINESDRIPISFFSLYTIILLI
jgi:hypothetical protein